MNSLRRCSASVVGVFIFAASALPAFAEQNKQRPPLRLQVGTVETRDETNLLGQVRAVERFSASQVYVVQLRQTITPEIREALQAAGVELGDYLPDQSYLARLDGIRPAALAALGEVAWIGEYQNAWKISPDIGARLTPFQTPERIALQAAGKYQLAVTLFASADLEKSMDVLSASGMDVLDGGLIGGQGVVVLTVEQNRLDELAGFSFVQFVEESAEITLRNNTNRWIVQSNVTDVTPLYDAGIHGEDQILGLLDTKLKSDHCSFSDVNPIGPTHRKILAYNTSLGSGSHGTHCAGIAVGDNGVFANTRGIAYLGKLVYDDTPSFTEAAVTAALGLHHSQGARIHTNSWGDDGTTAYNGLARGFDVFQYNNEESLCCLAVTNQSVLKNPENAKNLLAVGASQDTPNQGSHCSGGVGPTADGRRKPEIYAPGCSTNSASSSTSCGTVPNTGTSMACPAVAGTAMLVRQYYMEGYYPSGTPVALDAFTPSAALIKATLLNSAVDMTGISGYPSNLEGWGRLMADNALYFPGDARKSIVFADVFNASGLSTGQIVEHQFKVNSSSEPLRLTLVFTDVPGTSGAGNPVVNNLDLELVDDLETVVYKGNYFSGGASASGGTADAINNVEQILINNPPVGRWKAKVKATAVNQGTQGYALIGSGDINKGPLPPDAHDISLETPVETPVIVALDASDVDDDPLDFVVFSLPATGTLVDPQAGTIVSVPYTLANGGNQVEYQPAGGYAGAVNFLYYADDGGTPPDGGQSNTATVEILVKAAAPLILTASLPDGVVGQPYGPEQLQASGGQPPVVWQIVADVPYIEESLGTSGFAEVGVAQGWIGDDVRWSYALPFSFPFYNGSYSTIHVWSNGMIDFIAPHVGSAVLNSDETLMSNQRIAVLWDDLVTSGPGEDIYIDASVADAVTIRWKAHTYTDSYPVNFAVTLHASGYIDCHYGPGNAPITPTVGVSDGDGVHYTLASYNNAADLGSADSIRLKIPDQLSPGLTMSASGELSGTPQQAGAYLPVIRITDSLNRTDQAAIALLIATIPGDFDGDGDIDLQDLLVFTDCLNGPVAAPPQVGPPPATAECLSAFDFDGSATVDLLDYAVLQGVLTP